MRFYFGLWCISILAVFSSVVYFTISLLNGNMPSGNVCYIFLAQVILFSASCYKMRFAEGYTLFHCVIFVFICKSKGLKVDNCPKKYILETVMPEIKILASKFYFSKDLTELQLYSMIKRGNSFIRGKKAEK